MTNWSHKRPGAGGFTPEDIDPQLCTHVIYAFATLKNNLLSEGNDKDVEMYERLVALREKNPDIKVLHDRFENLIQYFIEFFDKIENVKPVELKLYILKKIK